jgi:hypothetical protein
VIGERVGAYYAQEKRKDGHVLLAKIGLASFVVGVAVKFAFVLLKLSIPNFALAHPTLVPLLSSYQKHPPGPTYVCFYAGAGLLLVAGVLETARRGMQRFLLNQLRQIGQASFFSFVVQFLLYHVLLPKLQLPYTRAWPLLFLLSLMLLAVAAAAWNSIEGNRFLTVGIAPLLERNARLRRQRREREIVLDVAARGESAKERPPLPGRSQAPNYSSARDSRKPHVAGM